MIIQCHPIIVHQGVILNVLWWWPFN